MTISERMAGMAGGGKSPSGLSERISRPEHGSEAEGSPHGEHSELHSHGDGTYHTVTDGEHNEHPHLHHALMHLAAHHEPEEHHSAVHHHEDGETHTTHHAKDGAVSGPHEHGSSEEMKGALCEGCDGSEGSSEHSSSHDGGGLF